MSILNKKEAAQASGMGDLWGALAKARVEFDEIPRTRIATIRMKTGGQYSYRYADLADMLRATTPALGAWGLSVTQWPEGDTLYTMLCHESGQTHTAPWPIKPMPQRGLDDAQQFQSAVQVAKRYALGAALGVSTEETIEGDEKAHKTVLQGREPEDPFVEEDGIRAPHGAKMTKGMGKREMAEEAARAIEAQMDEVKTAVGLNGVWNRNDRFIAKFQQDYDDLFQNIFDKFHSRMADLEQPQEGAA